MPKSSRASWDRVNRINRVLFLSCLIGILLSCYAYYVEVRSEQDEDYTAMCDISEHISCTKVFNSKYGRGFGAIGTFLDEKSIFNVPNGLLGVIFYAIFIFIGLPHSLPLARLQFAMSLLSVLVSIYLAYVLYFILHDFCVVCVSTYVVNVINFLYSCKKVKESVSVLRDKYVKKNY